MPRLVILAADDQDVVVAWCAGRQQALASEFELAQLFPDCETGAMPPFGNLFGIPVWVDDALGRESETVFNAGNHRETVHMAYADFVRLAKPSFGALTRPLAE